MTFYPKDFTYPVKQTQLSFFGGWSALTLDSDTLETIVHHLPSKCGVTMKCQAFIDSDLDEPELEPKEKINQLFALYDWSDTGREHRDLRPLEKKSLKWCDTDRIRAGIWRDKFESFNAPSQYVGIGFGLAVRLSHLQAITRLPRCEIRCDISRYGDITGVPSVYVMPFRFNGGQGFLHGVSAHQLGKESPASLAYYLFQKRDSFNL